MTLLDYNLGNPLGWIASYAISIYKSLKKTFQQSVGFAITLVTGKKRCVSHRPFVSQGQYHFPSLGATPEWL